VIRRRVDVRWRLQPEDFNRIPNAQFSITRTVVRLLKPGGVLVYSTCSLEPEENEELLRRLVAEIPDLRLGRKSLRCLFVTVLMEHSQRNCSKRVTPADQVASPPASGIINDYARRAVQ
jgi:16S rRNA C967 or C1407 C5-methylase (RsmB/RsmF family)